MRCSVMVTVIGNLPITSVCDGMRPIVIDSQAIFQKGSEMSRIPDTRYPTSLYVIEVPAVLIASTATVLQCRIQSLDRPFFGPAPRRSMFAMRLLYLLTMLTLLPITTLSTLTLAGNNHITTNTTSEPIFRRPPHPQGFGSGLWRIQRPRMRRAGDARQGLDDVGVCDLVDCQW
ncbi:hypothetical protein BJ170DRAFT_90133 [Xylariales sp. AK1849]|nr:hypothetical protein BJ170DRAFT_90133 [Xylariales sp. AK1849]